MKIFRIILAAIINVYKPSADPNLFGSKKLDKVAGMARGRAGETQSQIDKLESENPFESAGAKAAMAKAYRTSNQMLTRNLNVMGGNANPEALVAMQGAVNQGMGAAAGEIAVGAEANKKNEIANLQGLKENQMGQYAQMKNAAVQTKLQGWGTLFDGIGKLTEGVGVVKNALK